MTTHNFNNKIFVSYNGGSAGDLFVCSCNGIYIDQQPNIFVINHSSLKPYENDIKQNNISIDLAIAKTNQTYVSTHLNQILIDQNYKVISIVIENPSVQEKIIQRQMFIQTLSIMVNPDHHWFRCVRNWCLTDKYQIAAQYWFEQARIHWLDDMTFRLQQKIQKLNFDKLFTSEWANSLLDQGWTHNFDTLQKNHNVWLEKNYNFSKDMAINSIAQKLKKMNWDQQSGVIKYRH
jgi:hypothetical protein